MPKEDVFLKLEFKSLYYFVRSAETGSFSQTALSIGIAQSVLSRHILQLEKLVNGPLFFRTGRGVKLTELGEKLMPKAINLLRESEAFIAEAVGSQDKPEGAVRLGLPPGISGLLLAQLLPVFLDQYPKVRINVLETHSGEIEMMLADGRLDIGLYNRYRTLNDFNKELIYTQAMCLVGRKEDEILQSYSVSFEDLADLKLILPRHPNSLRAKIEELAAKKNIEIKIALEINPSLALEQIITNSQTYVVLPLHAAFEFSKGDRLAHSFIVNPEIKQSLYLETTRYHPLNQATQITEKHVRLLMKCVIHRHHFNFLSSNSSL